MKDIEQAAELHQTNMYMIDTHVAHTIGYTTVYILWLPSSQVYYFELGEKVLLDKCK
jgi:hypothetical protein